MIIIVVTCRTCRVLLLLVVLVLLVLLVLIPASRAPSGKLRAERSMRAAIIDLLDAVEVLRLGEDSPARIASAADRHRAAVLLILHVFGQRLTLIPQRHRVECAREMTNRRLRVCRRRIRA